jgi:hypothetical protein
LCDRGDDGRVRVQRLVVGQAVFGHNQLSARVAATMPWFATGRTTYCWLKP